MASHAKSSHTHTYICITKYGSIGMGMVPSITDLSPPCVLLEKAPMGNLQQKLMDTEQRVSRVIRLAVRSPPHWSTYIEKRSSIARSRQVPSRSGDFADEVNVKLTNFERAEFRTPSGLIGKPNIAAYHAPEMLRYSFTEEYTGKVDIYSFGMLLYELVTRWHPTTHGDITDLWCYDRDI